MPISEAHRIAPSGPDESESNRFRAGTEFRCRHEVLVSASDPLSQLNVEAQLLEAEVLEQESDFLLLDARARAIFARAARLEAQLLELGVTGRRAPQPVAQKADPAAAKVPAGPVPDDRFIDQRDGLVPKQLYLRLAREEAFPSSKIGKRVVARWGDVRTAIEARGRKGRTVTLASSEESPGSTDLDALRRQLSLSSKRTK